MAGEKKQIPLRLSASLYAAIAACDAAVRIPISPLVESLNASVAGSVLLWHFRRGGA